MGSGVAGHGVGARSRHREPPLCSTPGLEGSRSRPAGLRPRSEAGWGRGRTLPSGGALMSEPTLDRLHTRLDRLERELRWWRRAGIAALAAAGLLGAVAATVTTNPDEVKTRRLVITDGDGRGRAVFTVDESDRTRLSLVDRDGTTSADLTVIPGQSAALSVVRAGAQAQLAAAGDNGQISVSAGGRRGWLVAAPSGASL